MAATDEELVALAQSGDCEAMNSLLTKYKNLVNKISRSYYLLGGDIEDIVQEGMIGLYQAIISFKTGKHASFKTFAYICVKHQIQAAVKKASSEKNKILSSALHLWEQDDDDESFDSKIEAIVPSSLPTPDDRAIESENLRELQQKIKQTLSPLEVKVLSLYLKGYSYKEISQKGDMNSKSIDNALTRIKNKLTFLKKAE